MAVYLRKQDPKPVHKVTGVTDYNQQVARASNMPKINRMFIYQ